jgi:hypothetical protein
MRLAYHENLFCQVKYEKLSLSDFTINTTFRQSRYSL